MNFEKPPITQPGAEAGKEKINWDKAMWEVANGFENRAVTIGKYLDAQEMEQLHKDLEVLAVEAIDQEEQTENYAGLSLAELESRLALNFDQQEATDKARSDLYQTRLHKRRGDTSDDEWRDSMRSLATMERNMVLNTERRRRLQKYIAEKDPYSAQNLNKKL